MKFYKKISFQLIVLLSLLSISFGSVVILSYKWITETKNSIEYLSGEVLDINKSTLKIRTHIDNISDNFSKYIAVNKSENKKIIKSHQLHFLDDLEALENNKISRQAIGKKSISIIRQNFTEFYSTAQSAIHDHDKIMLKLIDVRNNYKKIDAHFNDELQKTLVSESNKPFSKLSGFLKKHSNQMTFLKSITPHLEIYSTNENLLKKIQSALSMEINIDETFITMEGYIAYPGAELIADFESSFLKFHENKKTFFLQKLTQEERAWGEKIASEYLENVRKAREIMALVDLKQKKVREFEMQYQNLIGTLEKISIEPIISETEKIKHGFFTKYQHMKYVISLSVAAFLFISFLALIYILRSIIIPLGKISKIISTTDIYNFPEKMPVSLKNEVGLTARVFEKMITRLKAEIKEKENSEKQMFQQSKLASIGELAAGVAHEINNPLAILRLSIDDLEKETQSANISLPELKKEIHIQKEAVHRINSIVKSLKHYTYMNPDMIEDININEAIADTLTLLSPTLKKDNISLTSNLSYEELLVRGNTGKLKQVLMNIITNARDALEKSTLKNITVRTYRDHGHVVIEIEDSGAGIPAENLTRIYDPFYTTKPLGKGSGMGLNICQKYIDEMGGTIYCNSEVNRGTCFCIKLKIKNGDIGSAGNV